MRYAEIMAGGSGTRLWPMSRTEQPKQLIPFINGKGLLEIAVGRLGGLVDEKNQFICTGEVFRAAIRSSLPQFSDDRILGEPIGRDTVNAVGFAAAVLSESDPDAIIAVFTADHLIEPLDVFQDRVKTAFEICEKHPSALVTFGIKPTKATTAYGYVQLGDPLEGFANARHTAAFKEKPDAVTAKQYVESGRYLWNSGMFVWRAETLLRCIKKFQPEVYAGLMKIATAWDTLKFAAVLNEVYPTLPRISVDYAVMEPAGVDDEFELITVEMPVNWSDVGSWTSYAQTCKVDDNGNARSAAKSIVMDTTNTLIASSDDEHLIATIGVEGLVVIHTPQATLICRREDEQRIKELHKLVGEEFGSNYL